MKQHTSSRALVSAATLQRDLMGAFTFLHPDIAAAVRLTDPAFVQAQAESLATIENPGLVDAIISKDPQLRRLRDESLDQILHPVFEPEGD